MKSDRQTFTLSYGEDKPLCLQRLSGLRIVTNQTFGVECELAHKSSSFNYEKKANWIPIAEKLLGHIRSVVGTSYCAIAPLFTKAENSQIDYEKWNVVFDGSCGWEIVSPILLGKEGFEDLVSVFDSMEKQDLFAQLNLDVDTRTGMHLHLGWDYSSIEQTKRLVHAIRRFSPAFYSLVAPSRLGNQYCKSVKNFLNLSRLNEISSLRDFASTWDDYETRYHDVNFQGVRRRDRTFEIRLHSGTYDGIKMAQWVALWMNLVHAIDRPHVGLNVDSTGVGRGIDFEPSADTDIVQIAVKHLGLDPTYNAPFLEKLYSRRLDVFSNQHWKEKIGEAKARRMLDYWQKEYRKMVQL